MIGISSVARRALALLPCLVAAPACLAGTVSAPRPEPGIAASPLPIVADPHRGGILRLTADGAFGSIDPQVNYQLGFAQVFASVYDGLVAFRKVDGPRSDDVVPDLADALPTPTDGGRTWVFHLRTGIRFSDGTPVTVDDAVASFRRMFAVLSPAAGSFFAGLVGADACNRAPASCTLAGGVSGDRRANTVTFHLVTADPEFLDQLAMPFASVLPARTPWRDVGDAPAVATGPYMIQSYAPNREMRLVRNPYFRVWSDDAEPDGHVDAIDYRFGLSDEAAVTAVENDQYDWMYDPKPIDRLGEIGRDFTARTHVTKIPATYYMPMNTRLYPFDHPLAREAVNDAVDRRALVLLYGGPGAASPICQVLPKDYPATIDYCPFGRGADIAHPGTGWRAPDLARARRLVAASGTAGAHVTIVTTTQAFAVTMGTYLQSVLRRIGYRADLRALDINIQFGFIQNTTNRVQISLTDWNADYPTASDFLKILYGCDSFHPGSDNSVNMSGVCDRTLDAAMARAEAAMLVDPAKGNLLWSAIDREITDRSYAANLFQENWVDLVSTRLGGYAFSQISHMLFSRVWVR